uniref:Monocopper oxidase-like protein SKU5 n=1 Tax=Kalanchoe fedtschenkoi TaxID=63787 RepID=A0A7N0TPB9_KALFE
MWVSSERLFYKSFVFSNLSSVNLAFFSCNNRPRRVGDTGDLMSAAAASPISTSLSVRIGAVLLLFGAAFAADPYVYYDWTVSYITAAPLGVKQQVIGVNGQFPGPILNVTTNWNVVVNVRNALDEPLLITWNGIQQRKNSWQDGVLGTNCPIPVRWNWTYEFQVKDQIGSFFYFPSINFQRAAGGYGGIIVNNRPVIAVPFGTPDGDITLFISDWFKKSHKDLRKDVEKGSGVGVPDGIIIVGEGTFGYQGATVSDGIASRTINVEPGKTYRFRVHNVGTSTSLNFRIQNHNLLLVETEGSYTVQQNYTNMDIHVGQSFSFLVTMDQNASTDFYIVASSRFVNSSAQSKASGVAILHYSNSQGPASGPLPDPPSEDDASFSMSQARSIRWNVTAGAARPNPQGSFKYGQIPVTDVYVIVNRPAELINGKWHTTLNGISYYPPATPLKLAQQFKIPGVYKLDFPNRLMNRQAKLDTSLINATYKGFIEIILQNNDRTVQSYHLDGYAFFVVGMDYGLWTENSRGTYNKWDGVARSTTQVFPGAWTAIMVSLDNDGIWNLRAQNLDSWYLGQELYLSVVNPETSDKTEVALPENVIYCGVLSSLQNDRSQRVTFSSSTDFLNISKTLLVTALIALFFTLIS